MFSFTANRFWLALAAPLFCIAALAQNTSTTTLFVTPTTVTLGQAIALSVTVTAPNEDPTPTGSVQLTVNGQSFASAQLTGGAASYKASSAGIAAGTYTLVATYSGDANTAASQSAGTTVTISPHATTTTLTLSPARVFNQDSASATIVVSGPIGGRKPSGTVTILVGGDAFDTVTLVNGTATVTSPANKVADGTYTLSAVYNGDAFNSPSTAAAQQLTVFGDTKSLFTISPTVLTVGSEFTVAVTIAGDGPQAPTGTVSFYSGGKLLTTVQVANGTVSVQEPTSELAPGTYVVTAKYSGDANNDPSTATTSVHLNASPPAYAITPSGAALMAGHEAQFSVQPASTSTVTWYVNDVPGGTAATGTINSNGLYTAPATPVAVTVTASEALSPGELAPAVPVYVVTPGTVSNSNNPQVAKYSIGVPPGANMYVTFGPTTSYGLVTWIQPGPTTGGTETMLIAGMQAPATYHMRARINFGNDISVVDADHSFTTKHVFTPPSTVVMTTAPGMTPSPGIEISNAMANYLYGYDMAGNMVWGMNFPPGSQGQLVFQPIKQMPNGHLLIQVSPQSTTPIDGGVAPGTTICIYEMELDGTIVRQLTLDQLNANLAASGYLDGLGNTVTLLIMHHDVTINPVTGHWLVLANTTRTITLPAGTATVLGDIVLDVDPNNNFKVNWVWNSFDHMDVTRHPDSAQDWTHTNAIVYSATDHNLLLSMRFQNWILKVDYNDGAGDGDILWHFGYEGDFTLVNGTSPQDWNWGQHEPAFTTSHTAGVFGLTFMDNGLDRNFPAGYTCEDGTPQPCHYSRAPQFIVDETTMTATLGAVMPYEGYSNFGGNSEILPNGDAHGDFCAVTENGNLDDLHAIVEEYTGGDNPQLVWSMDMGGTATLYRSHRWTSFYPGVT